jgi:hypothetical protein
MWGSKVRQRPARIKFFLYCLPTRNCFLKLTEVIYVNNRAYWHRIQASWRTTELQISLHGYVDWNTRTYLCYFQWVYFPWGPTGIATVSFFCAQPFLAFSSLGVLQLNKHRHESIRSIHQLKQITTVWGALQSKVKGRICLRLWQIEVRHFRVCLSEGVFSRPSYVREISQAWWTRPRASGMPHLTVSSDEACSIFKAMWVHHPRKYR